MQSELREKRTPMMKKYEEYQPFGKKRIQYNINRKQRKRDKRQRRIYKLSQNAQFSIEEDQRILRYVDEMGPKFVKIATFFPNKSYSMVKNRYYKHLRDRPVEMIKIETQRCVENTNFRNSSNQKSNEKLEELNRLIQTINFSPEITQITKSFIGELQKCLI